MPDRAGSTADASGMPPEVAAEVEVMSAAARAAIPARTDANLLVATWNLRAFAGLTAKWEAGPGESPQRDWHAVACIAAVLSCFDVVAIQEVRRDISALRFLMDQLGPDWRFFTTDVTEGSGGNGERLTFLHRTDRVQPSGLVGEIVLPDGGTPGRPATTVRPHSVCGLVRPGHGASSSSPRRTSSGAPTPPGGCRRSTRSHTGCAPGPTVPTTGTTTSWCSGTSTSTASTTRCTRRSRPPGCSHLRS